MNDDPMLETLLALAETRSKIAALRYEVSSVQVVYACDDDDDDDEGPETPIGIEDFWRNAGDGKVGMALVSKFLKPVVSDAGLKFHSSLVAVNSFAVSSPIAMWSAEGDDASKILRQFFGEAWTSVESATVDLTGAATHADVNPEEPKALGDFAGSTKAMQLSEVLRRIIAKTDDAELFISKLVKEGRGAPAKKHPRLRRHVCLRRGVLNVGGVGGEHSRGHGREEFIFRGLRHPHVRHGRCHLARVGGSREALHHHAVRLGHPRRLGQLGHEHR